MLTKLLKYDLKYMIKNMSVFYILSIFFALLTRILSLFETTTILVIVKNITIGTLIAMIANTLINTMIRSWIRFRDVIYKDESYLTHTLPVTKNDIYNSKFIQTLIFYIIGFLVIVISLFIAFYSKDNWRILKNVILGFTTNLNISTFLFVSGMLFIIFLEFFNAIQCGFLGIILGYRKNNGKIGFSILFGFIIYLVAQLLVLGVTALEGVFDSNIMDLFSNNIMLNGKSFITLYGGATILYVIIIFAMSFICKKILNKGVNVE